VIRLNTLLVLLGITVIVALVLHIGPAVLGQELGKLGNNLLWILLPSVGIYLFDALGWRSTLGRYAERVRFDRLFMTRMAGEAVNFTTPAAYLGGEPMKAYMLSRQNVPLIEAMASVITAKTTMTLAEVLFILMGVGIGFALLNRSSDMILAGLMGLGILGFGVGLFFLVQRRGFFVGLLRLLERLGLHIVWLKERAHKFQALDEAIGEFYARDRRGFALAFLFFFLGWVIGALEVYLVLSFLGQSIDFPTAFSIEAMAVFVKGGTAFIPGSLGGQEAGTLVLFSAFGYVETTGVTFALIRRMREIFWIVFGLFALAVQNRHVYRPDEQGRPPG
jgi:glycosyltransferase 2 family protein